MTSQRQNPRRKTILAGKLFDDDGHAWECTVKDLSETGAMVRVDAPIEKGMEIDLKLTKFEDIRRTEVIWARDGLAGLRYLAKIEKVPPAMRRLFTLLREVEDY